MCDALRAAGKIKSSRVYEAMKATDRGLYVAPTHVGPSAANSMRKNVEIAYTDRPQPIGHNATISAPHMHAMQLELLESAVPKEGGKVLDVGAGSGYIAACFARMVGTSGKVVGVEHIESLTTMAEGIARCGSNPALTPMSVANPVFEPSCGQRMSDAMTRRCFPDGSSCSRVTAGSAFLPMVHTTQSMLERRLRPCQSRSLTSSHPAGGLSAQSAQRVPCRS